MYGVHGPHKPLFVLMNYAIHGVYQSDLILSEAMAVEKVGDVLFENLDYFPEMFIW